MTDKLQKPSGEAQADLDGFLVPFGVSVPLELLTTALTHKSWSHEHPGDENNERLEFLGDAVLGQALTLYLYKQFPQASEGELSQRRAALVSAVSLAEVARAIGLGAHLRMGKGEERTGGRDKSSMLADGVEALIGAVTIANGPVVAERFVLQLLAKRIAAEADTYTSVDPKTDVQQEAQRRGVPVPEYVLSSEGPAHATVFKAVVELDGIYGVGRASSKKLAEKAAAANLLRQIAERRAARKPRAKKTQAAGQEPAVQLSWD